MTDKTVRHLTEEELDDVLLGGASAETQQHADECPVCAAQVAAFMTSMEAFNAGTMAWAQAKSNTVSRDLSAAQISGRRPVRWSVGVAMTAAMAFVMVVGMHRAPAGTDVAKATTAGTVETASAQEIAADNAMLEAINSEMTTAAPAPLRPFRSASVQMNGGRHNATSEVRN